MENMANSDIVNKKKINDETNSQKISQWISQRHLSPENLTTLKGRLSDQLEVLHGSTKHKLRGKLSWIIPESFSTPQVSSKKDR